jgi:type IV pilus assembly protein PilC
MTRHPKFFDALYLNMVKAGEAAGALDVVLERLAEYLEKSRKIRGQIRSAMVYPLIIMAVAVGVVSALIVFVVPKFESIFANMLKGQSLPGLTQMVLGISSLVQNQLWLLLGSGVLLVWGLRFLGRTAVGGRIRDRVSLAMPVLGDLLLKAAVARFARTLGTLLASGVQILNALQITRDTAGNVLVAGALDKVRERVRAGEGIAKPLAEQALFPEMVAGMVEVGEETGSLPDMLHRIADTYDEEVDNAVAALTSLLEPLMIVIMAVVVGVIVIALFLPLARIIQGLS